MYKSFDQLLKDSTEINESPSSNTAKFVNGQSYDFVSVSPIYPFPCVICQHSRITKFKINLRHFAISRIDKNWLGWGDLKVKTTSQISTNREYQLGDRLFYLEPIGVIPSRVLTRLASFGLVSQLLQSGTLSNFRSLYAAQNTIPDTIPVSCSSL